MDHTVDRAIVRGLFFHISVLVDGHENSSASVFGPLFAPLITYIASTAKSPPLLLNTSIAQFVFLSLVLCHLVVP